MLSNRIHELYVLEGLADNDTAIHKLHPRAKLVVTFAYIVAVVSFNRYDVLGDVPFFLYTALVCGIGEAPLRTLHKRFLIALPFCAFAGLTNLLLDRQVAFALGGAAVTFGLLSLLAILLRTYLCVMAVFALIATTPFQGLTRELRHLRMPQIFITLIEMIYRYIGVLIDEAGCMSTAYKLRSVKTKGIAMKDMGSFVGQLTIRSFDRGERVYAAMACRGYGGEFPEMEYAGPKPGDILFIFLLCAAFAALRVFPVLDMI
ncbi:MAG: cobalt ECF transporter T component CbiQ [Clostridiales Family XIII bacterium]|nr:cobalt ECF transporter T component CbiQ [Clostridiales Family XIII bacterium]